MKTLTKAAIGLSAVAAYVGVQKIRHAVSDLPEEEVEIHGFVSRGYEPVRDAFAENFTRRRKVGAACCVGFMKSSSNFRFAIPVLLACLEQAGHSASPIRKPKSATDMSPTGRA